MNPPHKKSEQKNLLGPYLERRRNRLAAAYAAGKVLDLGCGPSPILAYLDPEQPYVGVDIKRELIERLQSSTRRADTRFYCADIKDYVEKTGETFDTIFMIALIEHMQDPGWVLKSVLNLMENGGSLVITTPSPLADRLHGLLARINMTSKEAVEGHCSILSRRAMGDLMAGIGLEITSYRRFEMGLNQLFVCEKGPLSRVGAACPAGSL